MLTGHGHFFPFKSWSLPLQENRKHVENVLVRKGKAWHEQAVCDYFVDKKTNSKAGKQLFSKVAKDMASNVIKALYRGELSDPPGISWNTLSTFDDDRWKSQDRQEKTRRTVCICGALFVELCTRKVHMVKIPPPAMHLAPYPYFPIHQALQAPLA
jgi:hypothetical protein